MKSNKKKKNKKKEKPEALPSSSVISATVQIPYHPPPIQAGNTTDINSFSHLEMSLRSTISSKYPNLSSTANSFFSCKNICLVVKEFRNFQQLHFYQKKNTSSSNTWPMMPRIPDVFFRDRSRHGVLYEILVQAFCYKYNKSTSTPISASTPYYKTKFNPLLELNQVKKVKDNIVMFHTIREYLKKEGFIPTYYFYFDPSVIKNKEHHDIDAYKDTIHQFGGHIVQDYQQATHIIAHDPEIDSPDELQSEFQHADNPERLYLRTLDIRKSLANIHWWFFPSSADEWISSKDVNGIDENEVDVVKGTGAWVVGCRFLRDVQRFNEWGVEVDYAILDFEKSLVNKDIKSVKFKNHQHLQQSSDKNDAHVDVSQDIKSKSKPLLDEQTTSETPSTSKDNESEKTQENQRSSFQKRKLLYSSLAAPQPKKIKQSDHEVTVYNGALSIPSIALDLLQKRSKAFETKPDDNCTNIIIPPKKILPPSEDPCISSYTITELTLAPLPTMSADGSVRHDTFTTISNNKVIQKN